MLATKIPSLHLNFIYTFNSLFLDPSPLKKYVSSSFIAMQIYIWQGHTEVCFSVKQDENKFNQTASSGYSFACIYS